MGMWWPRAAPCAVCCALMAGCAADMTHYYRPPELPKDQYATLEASMPAWIERIDGLPIKDDRSDDPIMPLSSWGRRAHRLAPGEHRIWVSYDNRVQRSTSPVILTFLAKPGRVYEVKIERREPDKSLGPSSGAWMAYIRDKADHDGELIAGDAPRGDPQRKVVLEFLMKVAAGERTAARAMWAGDAQQTALLELHFELVQATRLWRARLIERFPQVQRELAALGDDQALLQEAAEVMRAPVMLEGDEAQIGAGLYGAFVVKRFGDQWKVVRLCGPDAAIQQRITFELRHRTTTLHAVAAEVAEGRFATPRAAVEETARRLQAGERAGV
jgi:hypothetical protein